MSAGRGVLSFSLFFENEKKRWLTNVFHDTVLQGEVENKLIAFANEHPDTFQSFIVRPGGVLARGNRMPSPLIDLTRSVKVDELAATTVEIALTGSEEQIVENWKLREFGRALLRGGERRNEGSVK
jgi:hypothetical protein